MKKNVYFRYTSRNILLAVIALGLCGCTVFGPQSIMAGRGTYNEVINQTHDEQILNALVRQRYDESFGGGRSGPSRTPDLPVVLL